MSGTLLVDITSAGTFADCTPREKYSGVARSSLFSAFAVRMPDVPSLSFQLNETVIVYAAVTEAIKVPKQKIRSHPSFWGMRCLEIPKQVFLRPLSSLTPRCTGLFKYHPLIQFTPRMRHDESHCHTIYAWDDAQSDTVKNTKYRIYYLSSVWKQILISATPGQRLKGYECWRH